MIKADNDKGETEMVCFFGFDQRGEHSRGCGFTTLSALLNFLIEMGERIF
jgi:hypothetical protein